MEESENSSGSETDLSDSWTFVNDDGSERGNPNPDREETSDSESLEVLDVEHVELEETCIPQDLMRADEDNHDGTCFPNDTDYSNTTDVPVLDVDTVGKVRMYVHHRNLYINMWLSVVMVITIAIALGLGIGHYLGSKRFVKTKGMIYHLKHENQMLEEELADIITKHKYCERSLEESVKHLMGRTKWCKFPNNFNCRNHYLQDNIYDRLKDEFGKNVCLVKINTVNGRSFKEFVVNQITPMFSHGSNHFNIGYTGSCNKNIGFVHPSDQTYSNSKCIQGDASVVDLCSPSPNINNIANKSLKNTYFSTLKSDLTFLHFSLSKWNNFINEYMKVHAAIHEDKHCIQHSQDSVEVANDIGHMNDLQINGHSNEVSHRSNKEQVLISSDSYCRLKVQQSSLQRDQHKHKAAKCKASSNIQIVYAVLKVDFHKPKPIFIGMNQTAHGTNFRNTQILKLPFVKKEENRINKLISYSLVENMSKHKTITLPHLHTDQGKLTFHDKKRENWHHKFTCSENHKQKDCKKNKYFSSRLDKEDSFSNGIKRNMKGKWNKFNIFMNDGKSKHVKPKNTFKKPKGKEEERKHLYSKKSLQNDSFKIFQYLKKKHPKQIKKEYVQSKLFDKRYFFKNKDKMWNDIYEKKEYIDKSKCIKNKCKNHAKSCKQHYKKKDCGGCVHEKKTFGDQGFHFNHIYLKSGYILEYTHKSKKDNVGKKNIHENKTYLQNLLRVHRGENFFREHWKERNKMYRINMQRTNVFKF